MKILLVNPPYQTFTSNVGVGHQIPLGLLMVGGPLLDAGHEVRLLDAECRRLSLREIQREVSTFEPDIVMTGHAGSTPAHPTCVRMLRAIKEVQPEVLTVYGGVYPTYHASDILEAEPAVDVIVRGEGEATTAALVEAVQQSTPLTSVAGLTVRDGNNIVTAPDRAPIQNLDAFRIGWELIDDWNRYQCFGLGRAAIVQFSRGCPHHCTYCGQFSFWVKWRHRDPVKLADEIEWLYREHDIRFVTIADENPTTRQEVWRNFLEEVARRELPVRFFTTIRATDIVRDAELMPLYRCAGIHYVLMGIETTDPEVMRQVKKGSTTRHDYQACQLLKQHGIYSVIGHVVGLQDESWRGFRAALRALKMYDGDYLNAMYVTPHRWSVFAREMAERPVVQEDGAKWDYRHQVLGQRVLQPWQVFVGVKWLELCFHLRPGKIWRLWRAKNCVERRELTWTFWHTSLVWLAEVGEFLFATSFARRPVSLGEVQHHSSHKKINLAQRRKGAAKR